MQLLDGGNDGPDEEPSRATVTEPPGPCVSEVETLRGMLLDVNAELRAEVTELRAELAVLREAGAKRQGQIEQFLSFTAQLGAMSRTMAAEADRLNCEQTP